MGRAFSGFTGANNQFQRILWQQHDSLFPFKCGKCNREFPQGGPRWIGSSVVKLSHRAVACECVDCHAGINPNRAKAPVITNRRTELD